MQCTFRLLINEIKNKWIKNFVVIIECFTLQYNSPNISLHNLAFSWSSINVKMTTDFSRKCVQFYSHRKLSIIWWMIKVFWHLCVPSFLICIYVLLIPELWHKFAINSFYTVHFKFTNFPFSRLSVYYFVI